MITDIFYTNITAEKNCELRILDAKLDHEHEDEFKLKIRLDTLQGLVNPNKNIANVSLLKIFEVVYLHSKNCCYLFISLKWQV